MASFVSEHKECLQTGSEMDLLAEVLKSDKMHKEIKQSIDTYVEL